MESSWFCGNNAVTIYTTFLNLDVDQNGKHFCGFYAYDCHTIKRLFLQDC